MIDLDLLKDAGTTNERLRQFFTAEMPSAAREATMKATKEGRTEMRRLKADVVKRKEFEDMIGAWIHENIYYALQNHAMFSAVDMAWDSAPVNKYNLPLLQFAQGHIDVTKAEAALKDVPNGDSYVKRNSSGQITSVDIPKFSEMNINLIRSVITRRVAAQSVKYELWPYFKYESRDNTQIGRLKADMTSQRMDIMADQYGYAAMQEQKTRYMLLYPNGCIAFPRCSWERDVHWRKKDIAPELQGEGAAHAKESYVAREGISWVLPHPSRVFYDNNYPISSLNTDSGCEYVGFWDVDRWGSIRRNPAYFNQKRVGFSTDTAAWFTHYAAYFNQFFDKVTPPNLPNSPGDGNDRKNRLGIYSGQADDVAAFFTNIYVKVIPKNYGWGDYPFPVWVHLKTAGDNTVIYCDLMPSTPGASFRFNCNDGRLNNISMAHELMQYQDQLTNLYSQLLQTIKTDLLAVAIINEDVFPDTPEGQEALKSFKAIFQGKAWFTDMQLLTGSFEKLKQVFGKEVSADMIFKVARCTPNTAITAIFEAITNVIAMAEKMMVLSSHEQGQAASHEISATESNQIFQSTDTIYSFISQSIDRGRSAMKRICYESLIACGSDEIVLPVSKRYPESIIKKAGFTIKHGDEGGENIGFITVTGNKGSLVHDYTFTSRDGGNRASNTAAAQVLTQLLQAFVTSNPAAQNAILSAMGKEKLFEMVNMVFRNADAGVDMTLEVKPGDDDSLMLEDDQQVMGLIQKLAEQVKQLSTQVNGAQPQPGPNGNGMPMPMMPAGPGAPPGMPMPQRQ